MVAVLIFNHVYFGHFLLGAQLVNMAITKGLLPICEIHNFANTYLAKVNTFQDYGLFCFGVLSNLLSWRWI